MNFAIRLTRPGDADALPAIERAAGALFRTAPGLEWIADDAVMSHEDHLHLIAHGACWVAEDIGSGIIGFIACDAADDALHIEEMSVHPDAQRRGVGRALIATAATAARDAGSNVLTLTTFRNLAWNEAFYRQSGFETLADETLDERLRDILAAETARGLPANGRCAMRLRLT